jgi:5-methyltetrahydrofolate--homocysteine methyltransferase
MMDNLTSKGPIFLDGALGTLLQQAGLAPGEHPFMMNITSPEAVLKIHREYVDAGSRIICANTFTANAKNLAGRPCTLDEVIGAGVKIAKEAAGDTARCALDMGPIGEFMEPGGTLSFESAYTMFRDIAVAGDRAGADIAMIETMSDITEMKAAILAVRENTDLEIIASMTFAGNGLTLVGSSAESFAILADRLGVDAVGINCSLGPDKIYGIAERMIKFTNLPLSIKPNAGLPDGVTGRYALEAAPFAEMMLKFADLGVAYVGGCCGTTPEYIRKLAEAFGGREIIPRAEVEDNWICSRRKQYRIDAGFEFKTREYAAVNVEDYIDEALEENDGPVMCLQIPASFSRADAVEAVKYIQNISALPLCIRTADMDALSGCLQVTDGVAAVSCPDDRRAEAAELARKYGAILI